MAANHRDRLRHYLVTNGVVAIAVALLAGWSGRRGDWAGAAFLTVGLALSVWWAWPLRGPHVDDLEARALAGPGDVIVYWRPGCVHCARLALRSRLTTWPAGTERYRVNIWRDPAGAARVRSLRGGNETVPTVVTADGGLVPSRIDAIEAVARAVR